MIHGVTTEWKEIDEKRKCRTSIKGSRLTSYPDNRTEAGFLMRDWQVVAVLLIPTIYIFYFILLDSSTYFIALQFSWLHPFLFPFLRRSLPKRKNESIIPYESFLLFFGLSWTCSNAMHMVLYLHLVFMHYTIFRIKFA